MNTINNRIQIIIDEKGLSPSEFSSQVGMQRSNLSHLLSGRNQPSFDIITKILSAFPDINSDWLLLGKGDMYRGMQSVDEDDDSPFHQTSIFDMLPTEKVISKPQEVKTVQKVVETPIESPKIEEKHNEINSAKEKKVTKIVIFYDDFSFDVYQK